MSQNPQTRTAEEEVKPELVPKLRFPEFQLKEGWHDAPIETLLEVRDERQPPTEKAPLYSLTIEDGVTPKSDRYNREFLVRDAANKKYKLVRPDDIVYNPSNLRWGAINFSRLNHEVVVSPIYEVLFVRDRSKLCFEFVAYAVMRDEQIRRFITKAQGTLVERIAVKIEDFIETGLHTPSILAEQNKIAECLSSVDELIAAQVRKVDALKTHKKGLMQQLFPREGESQPRLRFPEFQNAGGWVNKPLGDLGEIITGKTPSTKESDLWGGEILFITPTDISEDDKYQHTTARTVVETKSTKVLPEGSVVYTCIASIGKMALTVRPSITNQQINAVVPNKKALGEFIYYALANLTPWIKTIPASNTLPIINKTDFSKIAIQHPADKDEQQRIATCLSSLDALITAETQKLEALKTHKRGLMQQLFPSPEEATP